MSRYPLLLKELDRTKSPSLREFGVVICKHLNDAGFDTVNKVYRRFEELERDEKEFKKWLKAIDITNSEKQQACYDYFREVYEIPSAEDFRRAFPNIPPQEDAARGGVTSTGHTLHDDDLVTRKEMDEKINILLAMIEELGVSKQSDQ